MKKLNFILAGLMLFGVLFVGCQSGATAAETSEALCQLYVHLDGTNAEKLTLKESDVAEVEKTIKETVAENFKSNVTNGSELSVTDEQANRVMEATMAARKKVTIKTELLSEEKDKCSVKISLNPVNVTEADSAAAETASQSMVGKEELLLSDPTGYNDQFVAAYVDALVEELENVTVAETPKEMTVTCTKQGGVWLPEDMQTFGQQLAQMMEQ